MSKNLVFLSILLLLSLNGQTSSNITTVNFVDVSKFMGTWYRISSSPVVFEPKCLCARQVLSLADKGRVAVYNSCIRDDKTKKPVEIRGYASALDKTAAKLSVDFGLPWKGSYWIIGYDEAQGYAIVSDKWGYSLYIMSRTPDMNPELYLKLVEKAKASGVNVSRLKIQNNQNCVYP